MTLIYLLGFLSVVSAFAIVTNRFNKKPKCEHEWQDKPDGVLECSKCNRNIQLQNYYPEEEIAA